MVDIGTGPGAGFGAEQKVPNGIRPFTFHGVLFDSVNSSRQWIASACPWCGKAGKFHVDEQTTRWVCFSCDPRGGNASRFLEKLQQEALRHTPDAAYYRLAKDRGLTSFRTLRKWGICQAPPSLRTADTTEWLIPGYNAAGKLNQLYRYTRVSYGGTGRERYVCLATPNPTGDRSVSTAHGVHVQDFASLTKAGCTTVYVCEGVWDGLALWEVVSSSSPLEGPGGGSGSAEGSHVAVVAVPSANVFNIQWRTLFSQKNVVLLYDNDHPKNDQLPSGYAGTLRTAKMLLNPDAPTPPGSIHPSLRTAYTCPTPKSVRYLHWPAIDPTTRKPYVERLSVSVQDVATPTPTSKEIYNARLKDGYDMRDLLVSAGATLQQRREAWTAIAATSSPVLVSVPSGWVRSSAGSKSEKRATDRQLEQLERQQKKEREVLQAIEDTRENTLPCDSWNTLIDAWGKALRWTPGLDKALSVMLASVTSTKMVGDQLWIKVISLPSTGKSILCEALSLNKMYVFPMSTIRGFHSGHVAGDGEDSSLIGKLRDKTLVTKDGDTLLRSPNLSQILAEARDLYDSTSRSHYRNRAGKSWEDIRMTWLLCGTPSLRELDASELGERFLTCSIMDDIDDLLEDEINLRVARRSARNLLIESNGKLESRYDPDQLQAMRLTGGYVGYLREHCTDLLSRVQMSEDAMARCTLLGRFVAYMRARPAANQNEITSREFSARLVSQLVRLSICLAVVLNRDSVDNEVMRRVTSVAMDTSRGKTLDILHQLLPLSATTTKLPQGLSTDTLAQRLNLLPKDAQRYLLFLAKLGIIQQVLDKSAPSIGSMLRGTPSSSQYQRWVLTPKLVALYNRLALTT